MPVYQTLTDEEAERVVAEKLARWWSCGAHKYPKMHSTDWYFHCTVDMVAVAEIKCKPRLHEAWDYHFLDWHKYQPLWLQSQHDIPAYYVVQCTDQLVAVEVGDLGGCRVRVRGREDRATNDKRPCLEIPVEWFTVLNLEGPAPPAGRLSGART